jgi:glycine/D-amino acid oxidase-like deaminating enzyme
MNKRWSIAIVGAGSAGVSAAWRLRKLLGEPCQLSVYEREARVGGRARDTEFAGARIELGGTVLHSTGRHIRDLMTLTGSVEGESGLTIDGKDQATAFFTNQGLVVWTRATLASMAWGIVRHAGLLSALRTTGSVKRMITRWKRIYELQDAGVVFETPADLLKALGLDSAARVSVRDLLSAEGVSARMIDDIVEPVIQNMYNQGADIAALTGEVGLAGAGIGGGYLYSIEGGNWTVFSKTLDAIGAEVHLNAEVVSIDGKSADGGAIWEVTLADGASRTYDAVVLAAPLVLAGIRLSLDGEPLAYPVHPYQRVVATFVAGDLNPSTFRADPSRRPPSMIFVAGSAGAPFNSIGVAGFSPTHRKRIYKIFSGEADLSDETLAMIFRRIDDVRRFTWPGAYPKPTPNLAHAPFRLARRLYYGCALETVAASLEVEAVGGHNVGSLLARDLSAST